MKQQEGEEKGREGARGLGVHNFYIYDMLAKLQEVKLPRSSEKRASIAVETQPIWFLFLYIVQYKIISLHFYLLVTNNEAATQDTHRKKEEAQSPFYQDFISDLGQCTSIVFVIDVIIIISIQCSLLEEFSTIYCSSKFYKNKIVCNWILTE